MAGSRRGKRQDGLYGEVLHRAADIQHCTGAMRVRFWLCSWHLLSYRRRPRRTVRQEPQRNSGPRDPEAPVRRLKARYCPKYLRLTKCATTTIGPAPVSHCSFVFSVLSSLLSSLPLPPPIPKARQPTTPASGLFLRTARYHRQFLFVPRLFHLT